MCCKNNTRNIWNNKGKVDIKNIRDVEIEDLLGRETININTKEISNYLENKTILVTGGGGLYRIWAM